MKRFLSLTAALALTAAVSTAPPDTAGVDLSPLKVATEPAFPTLNWTGWAPETANGVPQQFRPIVLTHAGDGSNRVFVATEQGVIHVFPNDQKAATTKVFLDLTKRVAYDDKQNEEGFLGLTFHPDYKKNGEFFVFYTIRGPKQTNILSRFRVSKDDPDRADPDSEEELLRVTRPFWNHDGGTVAFGPDGYLYLVLGDGGSPKDSLGNAQNLGTLLGKILRLDVSRRGKDAPYAIPKDNPFVGRSGALPEIYAYGFRNVWRMAFDRQTKLLWAADVGQELWEEIDLVRAGGNYGWNCREGFHPFEKNTTKATDLVEPIWEYGHDVGKSITGGLVYRGKRVPALVGSYLYADYVTCKIWALKYDEKAKRVTANRKIQDRTLPIMAFGEDEAGEAYLLTYSPVGRGLYRFVEGDSR